MSSFFSCIGGKNPLKKKKKKGKELKKKNEPDVLQNEIEEEKIKEEKQIPTEEAPKDTDPSATELKVNIEDIKPTQTDITKDELAAEEKEPVSPLIKELHQRFEKMEKQKSSMEVHESTGSQDEETVTNQDAKHSLPKNFAKTVQPQLSTENDHETELSILRTRIRQEEKENENLREVIEKMREEEKQRLADVEKELKIEEELKEENKRLVKELEQLKADLQQQKLQNAELMADRDTEKTDKGKINEQTTNTLDDDGFDNAKGREEIMEAIGHLERVCSAFEPTVEKVEKIEMYDEEQELKVFNNRLQAVEEARQQFGEDAQSILKNLQEMECRVLSLEVSRKEEEEVRRTVMENMSQNAQVDRRLSDSEKQIAKHLTDTDEMFKEQLSDTNQQVNRQDSDTVDAVAVRASTEFNEIIVPNNDLLQKLSGLEDENASLRTRTDHLTTELDQLKGSNEALMNQLKLKEEALQRALKSNTETQEESKELKNQFQQTEKKLQQELEKLKITEQQLQIARHDYEDVMTRYSKLTADKVVTNNPNIETASNDLQSTPTSIANRFQMEVYGEKWCDAYERLTTVCKREEKKAQQILMDFCTEGYLHCRRISRSQIDTVWSLLSNPSASHLRGGLARRSNSNTKIAASDSVPEELKSLVIDYRKKPSKQFLDHLYEDFLVQLDYDKSRHLRHVHEREVNEISPYIAKCLEVCWEMVVQDPPMYLQFKVRHGAEIDKTKFDCYGNQGDKVDYLVWPCLLRDENGPLLKKGYIQAIPQKP